LFPSAKPMPGARRLTEHFSRHGIPQAVASSSHRRDFELKITRHREWFECFQCVVLGDDPEVRSPFRPFVADDVLEVREDNGTGSDKMLSHMFLVQKADY